MAKQIVPPSTQVQETYSAEAKAQRQAEAGLYWTPMGALNAAKRGEQGQSIMVFNTDTSVHYVRTGAAAVAAPTGGTDGIPVMAESFLIISLGPDEFLRSDSALVFGYKASNK